MATIGVRDVKTQTSRILLQILEQGTPLDITAHGEIIARIVPARDHRLQPEELTAYWAEWDRIAARIGALWLEGLSAVEAIAEDRREL